MNKIKYPTKAFLLLLFFLAISLSISKLGAAETVSNGNNDLTFSLGNLCEYIGQIQTDENGSTNKCSFNPYLASSLDFPISTSFVLSPRIALTLPKSGRDENVKRMSIHLLANTKYKTTYLDFIGGLGLFITRIWGPGGEAVLNNGNGSDSFPLPSEAVYARNIILNLGASYNFDQEWSAELHSYIFNALTSEERAFSIGINGTYHFGEVL